MTHGGDRLVPSEQVTGDVIQSGTSLATWLSGSLGVGSASREQVARCAGPGCPLS